MAAIDHSMKVKQFKWRPDMIENLLKCLNSFKSMMQFKNLEFDADKTAQYSSIRESMAALYPNDISLFGPINAPSLPEDFNDLSEKERVIKNIEFKKQSKLWSRGKSRVMEKIKEIRQKFSKAVISGSRSGSGKLVFEHYDLLVSIWGGSANVEPLSFGINGGESLSSSDDDEIAVGNDSSDKDTTLSTPRSTSPQRKRKSSSTVPILIDNKRKHLEKALSTAQRDQILMKEAQNDADFRRDISKAIRESNEYFASSIKEISQSMTDLSRGLTSSMEILSRAIMSHQSAPQMQPFPLHQNLFYQNVPAAGIPETPGYYTSMLNQGREQGEADSSQQK